MGHLQGQGIKFAPDAFRAGPDNLGAWQALPTIGEDIGRGESTVCRSLSRLEAKGLITKRRRFGASTVCRLILNPSSLVHSPVLSSEQDCPASKIVLSSEQDSLVEWARERNPKGTDISPTAENVNDKETDSTVVVPPVAPLAQAEAPSESKSRDGACRWQLEDGQKCGTAVLGDYFECLPHVVEIWWADPETGALELGKTWEKGISAAIRWYSRNPKELLRQVASLESKAEAEEEANHCAKCGQTFDDNRMNYRDSGKCLGCTFRPAATTLCFACEVTPVSRLGEPCQNCMDADDATRAETPDNLRWLAAVKELGRMRGDNFNIGSLLRDVPLSGVEAVDVTLRLPFRHESNLARFNAEYAAHAGAILETIAKHLPGITTIETTLLEGGE